MEKKQKENAKWEYKAVRLMRDAGEETSVKHLEDLANKYGALGWKLMESPRLMSDGKGGLYFEFWFKRCD